MCITCCLSFSLKSNWFVLNRVVNVCVPVDYERVSERKWWTKRNVKKILMGRGLQTILNPFYAHSDAPPLPPSCSAWCANFFFGRHIGWFKHPYYAILDFAMMCERVPLASYHPINSFNAWKTNTTHKHIAWLMCVCGWVSMFVCSPFCRFRFLYLLQNACNCTFIEW